MYLNFKILGLIGIFLFSGCAKETEYIAPPCPKMRTLKTVTTYNLQVKETPEGYLVQKRDLRRASKTSKILRKQNKFYKTQVISYNKKFK